MAARRLAGGNGEDRDAERTGAARLSTVPARDRRARIAGAAGGGRHCLRLPRAECPAPRPGAALQLVPRCLALRPTAPNVGLSAPSLCSAFRVLHAKRKAETRVR